MKPMAYISKGGILFKESPPDSMIELTPLYTMDQLTKNKEVYLSDYVKNTKLRLEAGEE
jgi:hypothetical protein